MTIVYAVIVLATLGALLGLGLAVASRVFAVKADPRIEQVEAALPGANCGACGFAGCPTYAESVVLEGTDIPRDIVTYPNAGHSFMNQAEGHRVSRALVGRPLMAVAFDEDASEDSWERIDAFFAEHL